LKKQIPVSILFSGGIDSTALLDFYLRSNQDVRCIHFQFGQSNANSEMEASKNICDYYKVKNTTINLEFSLIKNNDEVFCRNVLFILIAASITPPPTRIALGIHKGSRYYDSTKQFVNDCQRILDGYFAGTVTIEAPFLEFSKIDIMKYCELNDVPIELTYSCLRQNYSPCGNCDSCHDREQYFRH
jgi:7-cyano-7-deazaguanine synthase